MPPDDGIGKGGAPGRQAAVDFSLSSILLVLTPLVYAAGIAAAIHAVLYSRTSQGALAWALSLIYVPVVALPLYAVFGRGRFNGYVEARRAAAERFEASAEALAGSAADDAALAATGFAGLDFCQRLARLPVTLGNRTALLADGQATFDAIFAAIDSAERYVLLSFFIVRDDDLGRELKARLVAKARAGVRVCFLYDELGSRRLSQSYIDELTRAGVRVSAFNSTKGPRNRFQLNFRNHRKLVVVDGRVAFLGGTMSGTNTSAVTPASGDGATRSCGSKGRPPSPASSSSPRTGSGPRASRRRWTGSPPGARGAGDRCWCCRRGRPTSWTPAPSSSPMRSASRAGGCG